MRRILGGLWGAVVGDALGVPVEFTSRTARRADSVGEMRGFGTHDQPPGTWSDDSALLLCTVEGLCADGETDAIGRLFVAWRERGYWTPHGHVFDIGGATAAALARISRGVPSEEAGGTGTNDNGNGSLMRILPVALRYAHEPVDVMLDRAHRISALTHRHPRAQMACGLYCLAARALLQGQAPEDAYQVMIAEGQRAYQASPFADEATHFARLLAGDLAALPEDDIASGGYVVHTLEASLWCLLTTTSFTAAVLRAVNLGDDTDTTGCVTGGLAGLTYGEDAIPAEWLSALARRVEIDTLFTRFLDAR